MDQRQNFQRNNPQNPGNQPQQNQFPGYYKGNDFNLELLKMAEDYVKRYDKLSTSQLRNIYNEVKNIEKKVKSGRISENQIMTRIKLLKAKVRYNAGRNTNTLNHNFAKDLELWIDNVKNINDFKGFCILFEAVVGFFYGYKAERDNRR